MSERLATVRVLRGIASAWARIRAQAVHRRELRHALAACAVTATGLRAPQSPQAVRRSWEGV